MAEGLAIDWSQPIPLFPLQHCVLLPHVTIPLHIFEPRYRAMVADAIEGDGLIAMATFEGEQWEAEYEGNPPIRPVVCVGLIVRHEKLQEGRYNVLLQGVIRAHILRESPHDRYRLAMLEPIECASLMEIDLDEPRRNIEALLSDPLLCRLESVAAINHWISGDIPTVVLIDLAIMTCCQEPEGRYAMLAEPDALARAEWLEHFLRKQRALLDDNNLSGSGAPPPQTDDGLVLN